MLGYAPELQSTAFELVASNQPRKPVDKGEGYVQMAVSTKVCVCVCVCNVCPMDPGQMAVSTKVCVCVLCVPWIWKRWL